MVLCTRGPAPLPACDRRRGLRVNALWGRLMTLRRAGFQPSCGGQARRGTDSMVAGSRDGSVGEELAHRQQDLLICGWCGAREGRGEGEAIKRCLMGVAVVFWLADYGLWVVVVVRPTGFGREAYPHRCNFTGLAGWEKHLSVSWPSRHGWGFRPPWLRLPVARGLSHSEEAAGGARAARRGEGCGA